MKRRELLKKFGIGAVALPLAQLLPSQCVASTKPVIELPTLLGITPHGNTLCARIEATPGRFWSNTSGSVTFLTTWDEFPEIMETHAVDQCVVGLSLNWRDLDSDIAPWRFALRYPEKVNILYLTGGAGTKGVWQGFTPRSILGCEGVWGELTARKCCEAASLIQAGQLQKKRGYSYNWIEPPEKPLEASLKIRALIND